MNVFSLILFLFYNFLNKNLRKCVDPRKGNSGVSFNDTLINFRLSGTGFVLYDSE